MTDRRRFRPSIVVLTVGVAALAGLPTAAAGPASPPTPAPRSATPQAGAPPSGTIPGVAGGPLAAGRVVESMRFDPVSFRVTGSPAPAVPAAPVVAAPAQPLVTTTAKPGTAAARAIEFALAQRGLPYVWGGNGPQRGDAGFDCSGLTTAAYDQAGIDLPRTAHTQYYAGPHVPDDAALEPGDLVFYGVPERVHHVGLYLGEGRMVNAPTFGKPVRLAHVRYDGDDYLGATRPAAGIDAPADGLLATPDLPVEVPPVPAPEIPPAPEEFAAPEIPAAELPPTDAPTTLADGTVPPDGARAEVAPPTDGTVPPDGTTAPDGAVLPDGTTASGSAPPPGTTPPGQAPDPGATASGSPAPDGTAPDGTAAPGSVPPTAPAPAEGTTAPPGSTPPADPTGAPPAAVPSTAPGTTPPAPLLPATPPPVTTPPETTPPTTTPPTTASATGPARPSSLALPGGTEVALAGAEQGPDGLPVAPAAAGTGGLRWSPAEGERTARATVALHPDTDVAALTPGRTVTLLGEDGTTTELTIRSRDSLDAAGAADRAGGRGETVRLVLLRTDAATGEVLVVIAE